MGFALCLFNTKAKLAIKGDDEYELYRKGDIMAIKVSDIVDYVKSANLKGKVEMIGDTEILWDLEGIYLRFLIDDRETTVLYSHRKNRFFEIGHFHEDNCDVINLLQDINGKDNRVHISAFLGCSNFGLEQKTEKKKKSWLFVRHYYSNL